MNVLSLAGGSMSIAAVNGYAVLEYRSDPAFYGKQSVFTIVCERMLAPVLVVLRREPDV